MKALLTLLASLMLLSCAVNQQISIETDGSGTVSSSVFLEDFFLSTLEDLTDLSQGDQNGPGRLDALSIEQELKQNPYFSQVQVRSQQAGEYSGDLHFSHIEDLFAASFESGQEKLISYSDQGGGEKLLEIRINDETFQQIFQLFPMLQDPGFQYFLPERDISRAEYLEMLIFIFEDSENETVLRRLIQQASLDLIIKVNGRITEQTGGRILNDSSMRISLPLLDLLLHKNEIYYSLSYQER